MLSVNVLPLFLLIFISQELNLFSGIGKTMDNGINADMHNSAGCVNPATWLQR